MKLNGLLLMHGNGGFPSKTLIAQLHMYIRGVTISIVCRISTEWGYDLDLQNERWNPGFRHTHSVIAGRCAMRERNSHSML